MALNGCTQNSACVSRRARQQLHLQQPHSDGCEGEQRADRRSMARSRAVRRAARTPASSRARAGASTARRRLRAGAGERAVPEGTASYGHERTAPILFASDHAVDPLNGAARTMRIFVHLLRGGGRRGLPERRLRRRTPQPRPRRALPDTRRGSRARTRSWSSSSSSPATGNSSSSPTFRRSRTGRRPPQPWATEFITTLSELLAGDRARHRPHVRRRWAARSSVPPRPAAACRLPHEFLVTRARTCSPQTRLCNCVRRSSSRTDTRAPSASRR